MKIKQYAGGGISYLPTSARTGVAKTAASSADDNTTSKVPGFSKEIISLIKEHGLDSDVNVFLNQVGNILNVRTDPTGENLSMKEILRVQRLANQVYMNYADYKKARVSLDKEEAWGELATDKSGLLYTQNIDTGEIKKISQDTWNANKEEFMPLTNGDLMNIRKSDPTFAYRSDILDDISATVGMKTIVEFAEQRIKEFANTTITGYSEKQSDKIKTGLEHIVAGDFGDFRGVITKGPNGVYKITSESTIVDQGNGRGIKEALNYLYKTMPRQYKNTLSAKATVEGYDPDALLFTMMIADRPRKITADYDNTATKAAGGLGDAAGGDKLTDHDNLAIKFAKGDLTETTAVISAKPEHKSDRAFMAFKAWEGGRPVDKNYKPLEKNNLSDLLNQTFQLAGADFSSMSFGNQVISDEDLAGLVWDGQSSVKRVALPKKEVNGKTVPDFALMEALNEINKTVADTPGITDLEINRMLDQLVDDPSGIIKDPNNPKQFIIRPERIGIFGTIAAYGSEDLLKLKDESKRYVEKLSKDRGALIVDQFNNLVQYGKPTHSKRERPKNGFPDSEKGDFFYGNVYIAITDPMQAVNVTRDQNYTKDTFTNVNEKYIIGQQIADSQQASTWQKNWN